MIDLKKPSNRAIIREFSDVILLPEEGVNARCALLFLNGPDSIQGSSLEEAIAALTAEDEYDLSDLAGIEF